MPAFNTPPVRTVRKGFFGRDDLEAVLEHLPESLRPVARFAYLTGWRKKEILTLTWAQVDREAGVIRLEPGTTKNDEGREIPYRALPELDALINEQWEATMAVQRRLGTIVPTVFHREGKPILYFRDAWVSACVKAGNITGHKTESIYKRYAIADVVSLEEGLRKLASLDAAGRASATAREG